MLARLCGALATGVGSARTASAAAPASVPAPAPHFALSGLDGQLIKLDQFRGQVVYLDFWASWCGPCRLSVPWLNQMHASYKAQGLQIIGVNLDKKRQDVDKFLLAQPADFKVLLDPSGDSARAYDVRAMPSSVLIDRQGRIALKHAGFVASDKPKLESRIRQTLRLAVAGVALSLLSACAIVPVQAWEKGMLAKEEMIFDANRMEAALIDHTYVSKEGSFGGRGVGGGGCGCN
jgi:cytochrome c biogenesis protein CcmG/thiol:disulfide interchange protein DsbE